MTWARSVAAPINGSSPTITTPSTSASTMSYSGSEGWPTDIVLKDLRWLLHAFGLQAYFEFDIALRVTGFFD